MSERWPMFDIERDKAIIEAGGFWCSGCLLGKPTTEISLDPRYCQGCYDFLLKEVELESRRHAVDWRPQKGKRAAKPSAGGVSALDKGGSSNQEGCDTVAHEGLEGGNGVTDLIVDRIRVLAGQGMSCRAIEKELQKDDVAVSYRTIARRIKGQGVAV